MGWRRGRESRGDRKKERERGAGWKRVKESRGDRKKEREERERGGMEERERVSGR